MIPRSGNIPVGTVALPGIPPIGVGSKFTASQTSYWGPRASFEYDRHNIRGRAETATFGLVYSRLDQRASLTYANPRLSGSSWSSLFSLIGGALHANINLYGRIRASILSSGEGFRYAAHQELNSSLWLPAYAAYEYYDSRPRPSRGSTCAAFDFFGAICARHEG